MGDQYNFAAILLGGIGCAVAIFIADTIFTPLEASGANELFKFFAAGALVNWLMGFMDGVTTTEMNFMRVIVAALMIWITDMLLRMNNMYYGNDPIKYLFQGILVSMGINYYDSMQKDDTGAGGGLNDCQCDS